MNHLEQLVAEWLQYRGYFVRTSVSVGPRKMGGFDGELDVVGFNLVHNHLLHIECSLDADSELKRETKFQKKFRCGRDHAKLIFRDVFGDLTLPDPEQVLVLQFSSGKNRKIGGARLVTVREFIHEIYDGLKGKSPANEAVPSNLPLLRTLQLAADAAKEKWTEHRVVRLDRDRKSAK